VRHPAGSTPTSLPALFYLEASHPLRHVFTPVSTVPVCIYTRGRWKVMGRGNLAAVEARWNAHFAAVEGRWKRWKGGKKPTVEGRWKGVFSTISYD
jgi:hypothetical protein